MRLFWHQRDLRVADNVGLAVAARDDEVLPVYVYDPDVLKYVGERQRAFWMQCVRELKRAYREKGSDLLVRSGAAAEVLPALVEEFDADAVYYNTGYRPSRRTRQRRVERTLSVPVESRVDLLLVDPARLDPSYPNHSQFYNDWQQVPKSTPYAAPPADALVQFTDDTTVDVPAVDIDLPAPGYAGARARFDDFLDHGIHTYNDTRDDLKRAVEAPTRAVSRMSPYIAAGAIGIRELWADSSAAYDAATGRERKNVDKYRYELSWREQNYHLLYHNPKLLSDNYKEIPNPIEWRNDEADVRAWEAGETGYPLVDAGMRQLNREGYIHNRPRQVVASFLTKHLLVDWRIGAHHFADLLVDHDPASNYGNWQWIASTGTDSVDVRIFDPVSQMAKYDDGADFVREYVPELRDVPPGKIVDYPTLPAAERDRLAPDYPDPIVDRNEAYDRAQRVFERALGKR